MKLIDDSEFPKRPFGLHYIEIEKSVKNKIRAGIKIVVKPCKY